MGAEGVNGGTGGLLGGFFDEWSKNHSSVLIRKEMS